VPDLLKREMPKEQIHELLLGEVVPAWTIPIAETGKHVLPAVFQHAVNATDKLASVSGFHVVKAAHVKNKIEHLILEGQFQEAVHDEVYFGVRLLRFRPRDAHCCW